MDPAVQQEIERQIQDLINQDPDNFQWEQYLHAYLKYTAEEDISLDHFAQYVDAFQHHEGEDDPQDPNMPSSLRIVETANYTDEESAPFGDGGISIFSDGVRAYWITGRSAETFLLYPDGTERWVSSLDTGDEHMALFQGEDYGTIRAMTPEEEASHDHVFSERLGSDDEAPNKWEGANPSPPPLGGLKRR
jgi:hypothetical protein